MSYLIREKSQFVKNVFSLMFGSGVAQVILILLSPILTRMFSPEEFGIMALYNAIFSFLSVIVTLRYEQAIVLPKTEAEAQKLFSLSIYTTCVISFLFFILSIFFVGYLSEWFGMYALEKWLYLLPFSLLLHGLYQSFNYFSTRHKQFGNISTALMSQSLGTGLSQLVLGFSQVKGGLIIGQIIGWCCGVGRLGYASNRSVPISLYPLKDIWDVAIRYKKYPLFSTIGALSNSFSTQIPALVIGKIFGESILGLFSLTLRVITLPVSILSQGVSQVFLQKVARIQHDAPEQLFSETLKLLIILFSLMIPLVLILFFWGRDLFVLVFGYKWADAGSMAGVLVFAVACRFPVSAVSSVLLLDKTIKLGTLWQILYLFTISITLAIFVQFSFERFLVAFVIHEVVLSLVYCMFVFKGIRVLGKK